MIDKFLYLTNVKYDTNITLLLAIFHAAGEKQKYYIYRSN